MKPVSIIIVAAIIALMEVPASAADMAVKAAPKAIATAPVYSWTGFYIGANGGYGWKDPTVTFTPNDSGTVSLFGAGGAPPPASFGIAGILGGIQIGYNHRLNSNWLVGIETDFDGADIRGSGSTSGVYAPYFTAPFTAPVQERVDWFGTVRGRLGYLPTNNLLLYGTAGFAYGRVAQSGSWDTNTGFAFGSGSYTVNCFANPVCFAGSSSHVLTGWTAGGGFEYLLWQNWTLRAEYFYVSLGSASVTETVLGPTPGALPSSFNANFSRTNFNTVRLGLNYLFP